MLDFLKTRIVEGSTLLRTAQTKRCKGGGVGGGGFPLAVLRDEAFSGF